MTLPLPTPQKKILDHGYISLVTSWGSDEDIVASARMSTQQGFKGWPEDEKLLGYLWKKKHTSPFEMAGLTVEVQAPIFVFREWHRHRTMSYSEMSARYAPLPAVDYMPSVDRCLPEETMNKQARAHVEAPFGPIDAREFRSDLEDHYSRTERLYQKWLKRGLKKELARLPLSVGRYSRMRASANLLNWFRFLTLRMDPAAQWEIREYANAIGNMIESKFPRSGALFLEGMKQPDELVALRARVAELEEQLTARGAA